MKTKSLKNKLISTNQCILIDRKQIDASLYASIPRLPSISDSHPRTPPRPVEDFLEILLNGH